MFGCYYDYYYHLNGMRLYIPVFIREVLYILVEGIVADRQDDECRNTPPLSRNRMSVFSQATDAAAYIVAQQIKSDHSVINSFRCDDVVAAIDDSFLQERAYVVQYRICVTCQSPFP